MIWYVLGTAVVVFGGVASLIFLALSLNRRRSAATLPQVTQPQPVSQQESDWEKWGKRFGWVFFGFIVFDIWRKFIFSAVPVEWKEWAPSFSWNTFEILVVLVGVYFLWGKRKKKPASSGGQTTGVSNSRIVVTDVPYEHNPPPVLYNGVPQVKWVSSVGESLWNAFAIPIVVIAIVVGLFYASNEIQGLQNLWKWASKPVALSMGLLVLLGANVIMAFLHKSNCFPVLAAAILGSIIGYILFRGEWFTVQDDFGTVVPAIVAVLPAVMLSCYALWKSDFVDWRVPGAFTVLLVAAFVFG